MEGKVAWPSGRACRKGRKSKEGRKHPQARSHAIPERAEPRRGGAGLEDLREEGVGQEEGRVPPQTQASALPPATQAAPQEAGAAAIPPPAAATVPSCPCGLPSTRPATPAGWGLTPGKTSQPPGGQAGDREEVRGEGASHEAGKGFDGGPLCMSTDPSKGAKVLGLWGARCDGHWYSAKRGPGEWKNLRLEFEKSRRRMRQGW